MLLMSLLIIFFNVIAIATVEDRVIEDITVNLFTVSLRQINQ